MKSTFAVAILILILIYSFFITASTEGIEYFIYLSSIVSLVCLIFGSLLYKYGAMLWESFQHKVESGHICWDGIVVSLLAGSICVSMNILFLLDRDLSLDELGPEISRCLLPVLYSLILILVIFIPKANYSQAISGHTLQVGKLYKIFGLIVAMGGPSIFILRDMNWQNYVDYPVLLITFLLPLIIISRLGFSTFLRLKDSNVREKIITISYVVIPILNGFVMIWFVVFLLANQSKLTQVLGPSIVVIVLTTLYSSLLYLLVLVPASSRVTPFTALVLPLISFFINITAIIFYGIDSYLYLVNR